MHADEPNFMKRKGALVGLIRASKVASTEVFLIVYVLILGIVALSVVSFISSIFEAQDRRL
jgi:hypothetical protein